MCTRNFTVPLEKISYILVHLDYRNNVIFKDCDAKSAYISTWMSNCLMI